MAATQEVGPMAATQGLQQPLLDNPSEPRSRADRLRYAFAKRVLKARFGPAIYQTLNVDDVVKDVARPLASLFCLIAWIFSTTVVAMALLYNVYQGITPLCTVYDSMEYPALKLTPREWTNFTILEAVSGPAEDVNYSYSLVKVAEATGNISHVVSSPPWRMDITGMQFPLTVTLFHENAIHMAELLSSNIIVQALNPFWMILSLLCLWGQFSLSVVAPGFHVLQLVVSCMLLSGATMAMANPPEVHPPLTPEQTQIYAECIGSDHGLWLYTGVLVVQIIVCASLLRAAELVRKPFMPLIEFAQAFKGIKFCKPKECGGGTCGVCLDALDDEDPKWEGGLWMLPCSHIFHKDCVLPWLIKPGASLGTCPICRASQVSPGHEQRPSGQLLP